MAERFRLCCLIGALAVLLAGVPARAAVTYGELEFAVEPEPKGNSQHGYTEYRIHVRNRSTRDTHRVTLSLPGDNYSSRGNQGALQAISRTVEVGPGLIGTISLLQPAYPDVLGSGISVRINGRREDKLLQLNPTGGGGKMGPYRYSRSYGRRGGYMGPSFGGGGVSTPLLLVSRRIEENFFNRSGVVVAPPKPGPFVGGPAAGGPPGGPGMGGMGGPMVVPGITAEITRADMPITDWTNRWLGYTRYDGIAVTREDLEQLQRESNDTRAVLQALWQYTEAGGILMVIGPGAVAIPPAWKRPAIDHFGIAVITVGFGQCLITPDGNSQKWTLERWGAINGALKQTGTPWESSRNLMELNQAFPVVDDLGVPVRGLFALMILFSVALGPVNLVVLGRKKKRIWMLWTVPALSFITCMAVFGYMIVAEGWQGHARVAGITLLDEVEKRATTLGRTAFYSPLTPGDGLHFSEETEVQVQGGEYGASSSSCSMDWTQGQHLARGWVTARIPAHFSLRKCEPRRERLNIRREADGKLELVNALGVDIKSLWVADEKGLLYTSGPIAAGERSTLERSSKPRVRDVPGKPWRQSLYATGDWMKAALTATKRPEEVLMPRTYLAVVEASPFLEQGMRGAAVRSSESVVLGMMADLGEK